MLTILRILVAATIFVLGILLGLTGLGVLSISRSRLNKLLPNHIAARPITLGVALIALNFAFLYAPFDLGPFIFTVTSALLVTCAMVGLVFLFGHVRIESDGKITLLKWPNWDKDRKNGGMNVVSRVIGVFVLLPALFLLIVSLGLFGLALTSEVAELVLKAVSTALSTVLIKLVVGNIGEPGKKIEGWVVTIATVLLFVGLLTALPAACTGGTSSPTSVPATATPAVTPTAGTTRQDIGITGFDVTKKVLATGEQTQITVHATGRTLTYRWSADYGAIEPDDWSAQPTAQYTAPNFTVVDVIHVTVRDADGNIVNDEISIQVVKQATP